MAQGFAIKPPKVRRSRHPAQLPGESDAAYKAFCRYFDGEKAGQPIEYPQQYRQYWVRWETQFHWAMRVDGKPLPPPETFTPPEGAPPKVEGERPDQYQAFCYFWQAVKNGDRFPLESAQTAYKTATAKPGNLTQWKDTFRWLDRTGQTPAIPQGRPIEPTQLDMLTLTEGNSDRLAADLQAMLDYLALELQVVRSARSGNLITPELMAAYKTMPPVPERLPEASRAGRRLLDTIFVD